MKVLYGFAVITLIFEQADGTIISVTPAPNDDKVSRKKW
jgi:hypothetical protein